MARVLEKQKAIELRKLGKSYGEINKELGISKSTLSDWLKDFTLSKDQLDKLRGNISGIRQRAIELTSLTKLRKRQKRFEEVYKNEKKKLLPLTEKELYLSGLFLYWGEGRKGWNRQISVCNTDPRVMKFYLYWLTKSLRIPRVKIKVNIHLYSDMDIPNSLSYWSRELNIPLSQFNRPYVKKSKFVDVEQKGFGHGTCGLSLSNRELKEKITFGLEAIADCTKGKI